MVRRLSTKLVLTAVLAVFTILAAPTSYQLLIQSAPQGVKQQLRTLSDWMKRSWRIGRPNEATTALFVDSIKEDIVDLLNSNDPVLTEVGGTCFGVLCIHLNDAELNRRVRDLSRSTSDGQRKFAEDALDAIENPHKWSSTIEEITLRKKLPDSPFGSWVNPAS